MTTKTVCAIFKNERPFLLEWIAYHQVIGFDHFVLFDNGSTDGGADEIRASGLSSNVEIIPWPERPGQLTAYKYFFDRLRHKFDWAAFIDVDEFIHPLASDTIEPIIEKAGAHPAILLNWLNFGPNGQAARIKGLVMEGYTTRLPDNNPVNFHVKSIVRCSAMIGGGGAHVTPVRGNPCNALGETIGNEAITKVRCAEGAVINHYYTKSHEDWVRKVGGGRATVADDPLIQRKLEWIDHYVAHSRIEDRRILRFLPRVRDALFTVSR